MSKFNEDYFEELKKKLIAAQAGDRESYQSFLRELYPFLKMIVGKKVGNLADKDDVPKKF